MNESIRFYLASGEKHPDEEKLQQSAFTQLIWEQLQKHDAAFGINRMVDMRLSDDGESVMLKLSVIDDHWGHFYDAQVTLEALTTSALPEQFRRDIADWFDQAAGQVAFIPDKHEFQKHEQG